MKTHNQYVIDTIRGYVCHSCMSYGADNINRTLAHMPHLDIETVCKVTVTPKVEIAPKVEVDPKVAAMGGFAGFADTL